MSSPLGDFVSLSSSSPKKKDKKSKKARSSKKDKKRKALSPSPFFSGSPSPVPSPNNSPLPGAYTDDFLDITVKSTKARSASPKGSIAGLKVNKKEKKRRLERSNRFLNDAINESLKKTKTYTPGPGEGFGTSGEYSKPYARLTSAPDPSTVRPLPVLSLALAHHNESYLAERIKYGEYISELKSIRQDLTVQHLEGDLMWKVYEDNVKASLENGDLEEYSVCSVQLENQIIKESQHPEKTSSINVDFILSLRLLHSLVKGTLVETLIKFSALLNFREPLQSIVSEVIRVHEERNYVKFFRLYDRAPEFIDYMMDFLVKKFRGWLIDGSRKCYMSIDLGVVEDWGGWDAGEFVEDEMIDEITVVEGGKWFCKR
ncbi:hypothetical protein TrVE_jg12947 [Triparma verrucosa]|uniref:Uncharacterized protein n=1 Tax=Triparma verrucosa TaxID=1606542 RepID=A0A9W7EZ78_9STRA|nr:hypothetical protein TrVE_jg12947 [Triparma verrucosa]